MEEAHRVVRNLLNLREFSVPPQVSASPSPESYTRIICGCFVERLLKLEELEPVPLTSKSETSLGDSRMLLNGCKRQGTLASMIMVIHYSSFLTPYILPLATSESRLGGRPATCRRGASF